MKPFLCILYAIMFLCDSRLPSFASRRAPSRASRNQITAGLQPLCELFVDMEESLATAIVSLRLLLHSARRSVHSNPSSNNFKRLGRGRAAVLHRILPLLPNNHVCEHAQSRPHRMLLGRAGAWMTTRKAGTHLMRTRMTMGALMPVTRQLWTHVHRPRHHHHHFQKAEKM